MEKFGELGKQLNPPNMNKNGFKYDSGLTFYPGTIRIVSLPDIYIPNTKDHLFKWGHSDIDNAFTSDISEYIVEQIMLVGHLKEELREAPLDQIFEKGDLIVDLEQKLPHGSSKCLLWLGWLACCTLPWLGLA